MREFLLLILSLFIPVVLWVMLVSQYEAYVWNHLLNEEHKTLVLGDSHAKRIEVEQGLTLAKDGDPYLLPLLNLRRVLATDQSPLLSNVVVTVGPHNFGALPENRLNQSQGFESWWSSNGQRIANALKFRDYVAQSEPPVDFLSCLKFEWLVLNKGVHKKPAEWNGERAIDRMTARRRVQNHEIQQENWFMNDGWQCQFLSAIVEECGRHDQQLLLLGTPLHPNYHNQVGKNGWRVYKEHLQSLDSLNSHVTYLSFEKSEWPDSLFMDADHVNDAGGRALGRMIQEYLD